MAKRKKSASRRRHSAPRSAKRHRRRRSMGAGITGIFSNPLIGAAAGAIGAGFIGYMISKPGSSGKPMIENPMLRIAIIAGVPFIAAKYLKSPALGLGGIGVGAYELGKTIFNKTSPKFALQEGEIQYVDANLLNEAATLADGTTLADENGDVIGVYENGQWSSPYSADTYN